MPKRKIKEESDFGLPEVSDIIKEELQLKPIKRKLKIPASRRRPISTETIEKPKYQWKGRKVKKIVRPGTAFMLSNSKISGRKRQFDDLETDTDILEQARNLEGEFAYGKRFLPLDTSNPTPNLTPITPQTVVATNESVLQPTVQLLTEKPLKRKRSEITEPVKRRRVLEPDSFPSVNFETSTLKRRRQEDLIDSVFPNSKRSRTEPKIIVRPLKRVKKNLSVQTVDVQIPDAQTFEEEMTRPIKVRKQISIRTPDAEMPDSEMVEEFSVDPSILQQKLDKNPEYFLHPSITVTPGYKGFSANVLRQRRHRKKYKPTNAIIPQVKYHPSLQL